MDKWSETSRYEITHGGRRIAVETDESGVVSAKVRLFVDGRLVTERSTFLGSRLHGQSRSGPVTVKVAFGVFGEVTKCVLLDGDRELPLRRVRALDGKDPEDGFELLDFLS